MVSPLAWTTSTSRPPFLSSNPISTSPVKTHTRVVVVASNGSTTRAGCRRGTRWRCSTWRKNLNANDPKPSITSLEMLLSVLPLFPVCDWAAGWKWAGDCCRAKDAVWPPAQKLTQLQLSGRTGARPNHRFPDFLWGRAGQRALTVPPWLLLGSFTDGILSFHLSLKVINQTRSLLPLEAA